MRKFFLAALTLPVLFMASCVLNNEEAITGGPGTITISAQTDTGIDAVKATTRAEENVADYWLSISGPGNMGYERVLGTETTISDLMPGNYTVSLTSRQTYVLPAFDLPIYGATSTRPVASQQTTTFALECKQINAGIKLIFAQSALDYYADLKVNIAHTTDSDKALRYTEADATAERTAYFEAPSALRLTILNGEDPVKIGGADYQDIEALPREVWTITLKTSSKNPGQLVVEATVDTGTDSKEHDFGIGDTDGEGTLSSPYSVTDAINSIPANDVWVEGYIVGSTTITETRAEQADNILIGEAANAQPGQCLIVRLEQGTDSYEKLNLVDNPGMMGRRIFVKGDVAGRADGFTSEAAGVVSEVTTFAVEDETGLSTTMKDLPYPVGGAVRTLFVEGDPDYVMLLTREMKSVTAEYEMKMKAICGTGLNPDPASWNWGPSDRIVDFAENNGLRVHGHTLIWNDMGLPAFMSGFSGTRDQWIELMTDYIKAVVGRYKGRIASWDVINEAYDGTGEVVESVWSKNIGLDYLDIAFAAAREADPDCLLFYNDNLEYATAEKLTAVYAKLNWLKSQGLIDGVGIQMHVHPWFDRAKTEELFQQAANTGLLFHVSELDVHFNNPENETPRFPEYPVELTDLQNGVFVDVFEVYNNVVPAAQRYGITFWAVTDKYPAQNETPDWPAIFDVNNKPKGAYYSILGTL